MTKKCSKHGLSITDGLKHCPACGEELFIVSMFPFKIYFSRIAALIVMIPVLLYGTVLTFDMPGCVAEYNQKEEDRLVYEHQLANGMPTFWRDLYFSTKGMNTITSWSTISDELEKREDHSLSYISGEQLALLQKLIAPYNHDDMYELVQLKIKKVNSD